MLLGRKIEEAFSITKVSFISKACLGITCSLPDVASVSATLSSLHFPNRLMDSLLQGYISDAFVLSEMATSKTLQG